jgi:hypothetical protein
VGARGLMLKRTTRPLCLLHPTTRPLARREKSALHPPTRLGAKILYSQCADEMVFTS